LLVKSGNDELVPWGIASERRAAPPCACAGKGRLFLADFNILILNY